MVARGVAIALIVAVALIVGVGDGLGFFVATCLGITICGVAVGGLSELTLFESNVCGGKDEPLCCGPQALKTITVSKPSKMYSFLPTTVQTLLYVLHYKAHDL